jgi:hypothetical protein
MDLLHGFVGGDSVELRQQSSVRAGWIILVHCVEVGGSRISDCIDGDLKELPFAFLDFFQASIAKSNGRFTWHDTNGSLFC